MMAAVAARAHQPQGRHAEGRHAEATEEDTTADEVRRCVNDLLAAVKASSQDRQDAVTKAMEARLKHQASVLDHEIRSVQWLRDSLLEEPLEEAPEACEIPMESKVVPRWCAEGVHMERLVNVACHRHAAMVVIASCSHDGTTVVQTIQDGQEDSVDFLAVVSAPDAGAIEAATFVPTDAVDCGWVLATGGQDRCVCLYSELLNDSDQELLSIPVQDAVASLSGCDPGLLAVASGPQALIWDLAAAREDPVWSLDHEAWLQRIHQPAKDIAIALTGAEEAPAEAAGRPSISTARDPRITLWDLRQRRKALQLQVDLGPERCYIDAVTQPAPHPGILVASGGSSLKAWDMRKVVRPLHRCDDLPIPPGASITSMGIDVAGGMVALGVAGGSGDEAPSLCICDFTAGFRSQDCALEDAQPITALGFVPGASVEGRGRWPAVVAGMSTASGASVWGLEVRQQPIVQ